MVFGSYEQVTFVDDLANLTAPILKITIYDHKAQCFNHVNDLAEFQDDLYIVAAEESWIDITDKAVDKGTTIQFYRVCLIFLPMRRLSLAMDIMICLYLKMQPIKWRWIMPIQS